MNEEKFWALIERAVKGSENDPDEKREWLKEEIEKLSPDEVVEFAILFDRKEVDAYRWDLWAAAYIIQGGCSDDAFMDFRASLICMGREIYERALADPDSLAAIDVDDPDECLFYEGYQYLVFDVYEGKTGNELPPSAVAFPDAPAGDEWDEDSEEELKSICPKLFEMYWDEEEIT